MRKSTVFVLGFATAFAFPLTRAFITGMQIGIAEMRDEHERKQKIAQYPLSSVN